MARLYRTGRFLLGSAGLRLLKAIAWASWLGGGLLPAAVPPTVNLGTGAGLGRPDARVVYIALDRLGFQQMPPRFVSTGATMMTLHFVDEQHLLFTFTVRGLMPRLPDQEPEDDDRKVRALLLELPDGKVLAQTEWRTRDRNQYLWPLDHGRFLLRVRSSLTVIDPLRNFSAHGAARTFEEQPFLQFKRRVGYVSVSPGGELLGVELLPPRKPKLTGVAADAASLAATVPGHTDEEPASPGAPSPVQIYFFRLREKKDEAGMHLQATTAGSVGAPGLISLAATSEGFLDIKKESARSWLFDFVTHSGKRTELSAYDTSCAPHPTFVSRSEFVAFGCRGSSDKAELSFFNLKGEEPWVSVLSGTHVSPSIVSAPGSGRFALGRTLVNGAVFDAENLSTEDMTSQEITVFQGHDGRILLTVQASPIQRTGQNFDLSPSGQNLAVVKAGNIEIHRLPELSKSDRKAVEVAEGLVPPDDGSPVRLNGVPVKARSHDAAVVSDAAPAPPAQKPIAQTPPVLAAAAPASPPPPALPEPSASVASLPAAEALKQTSVDRSEGALGDPQEGARKKPTLYTDEYPAGKSDPKTDRDREKPHQE